MIDFISKTLELTGTLLVAYAALRVHHRFLREHKVDEKVFKTMRREQRLGILGAVLIIIGYFLNILF